MSETPSPANVCSRPGCGHRRRYHEDQGDGRGQACLNRSCSCPAFVELADTLLARTATVGQQYWAHRHPSVKHFEPLFAYSHLPEHLQQVSEPFTALAHTLLARLKDGPELSTALRKLLEAKDCAVRQAVIDRA